MDQIPSQTGWERELVTKLAQMNLKEQRAKRRWTIFFRLLWIGLAFLVFAAIMGWIGHGTGGSEYSVALLAMLLVIAADDATRTSRPIPSSREADPT